MENTDPPPGPHAGDGISTVGETLVKLAGPALAVNFGKNPEDALSLLPIENFVDVEMAGRYQLVVAYRGLEVTLSSNRDYRGLGVPEVERRLGILVSRSMPISKEFADYLQTLSSTFAHYGEGRISNWGTVERGVARLLDFIP